MCWNPASLYQWSAALHAGLFSGLYSFTAVSLIDLDVLYSHQLLPEYEPNVEKPIFLFYRDSDVMSYSFKLTRY